MNRNEETGPLYSDACPPFFVKQVQWAKTSGNGYVMVGLVLATEVRKMVTGTVAPHVLEDLNMALRARRNRDDRLWGWFKRTLPRCMALVSPRRRARFMKGVNLAVRAGEV